MWLFTAPGKWFSLGLALPPQAEMLGTEEQAEESSKIFQILSSVVKQTAEVKYHHPFDGREYVRG